MYRIANRSVGNSSAVVSPGTGKRLFVDPQGRQDPNAKWNVQHVIETNNYNLYISPDQYATVDSDGYLIAGSEETEWSFVETDDHKPMVVYLKDANSEKAWEYDADTNTIKLATLDKSNNKQIWEFA